MNTNEHEYTKMFKNEACEKPFDTRTYEKSILALKHFNNFLPLALFKVFDEI